VLLVVGCGDPYNTQSKNDAEETLSSVAMDDWEIGESKIDIGSTYITNLAEDSGLIIKFGWQPKDTNSYDSAGLKFVSMDHMYQRDFLIYITNTSKIVMNVTYVIPSKNLKASGTISGLFSNIDSYKNLKGKIQFRELNYLKSNFDILLTGGVNDIEIVKDTILNEHVRVEKVFPKWSTHTK
jgi:hypothetical protein